MAKDPYEDDPSGAPSAWWNPTGGASGAPITEEELARLLAKRDSLSNVVSAPPPPAPPPSDGGTPSSPSGGSPAYTPGGGYTPPAPPTGGVNVQATTGGSHYNTIWDRLMQQMNQGTHIDQNDPNFRQQADTFAASTERARRNQIPDNAEEMSARMLGGSGAQAVANRMVNEDAQHQQATFEAQLVGSELKNRRDEIQSALNIAANMGKAEEQRALTKELGLIDAQLRQMGIESNERIANNNLGFNYTALEANQNNAALLAALGQ